MEKYRNLILCEGETDQALIGSYLEATAGWGYLKKKSDFPFQEEKISAYQKDENNTLGIWQVGGNDFSHAIDVILEGAKKDNVVDNIAIVTDHDDQDAEQSRPQAILNQFSSSLGIGALMKENYLNKWSSISYNNVFGSAVIRFCYLLVPLEEVGALETFMMNSLSEQSPEKESVISQAKTFIRDFPSEIYLKERREKVKAELGISLSVFSPDRVFTTMKELIDSVSWGDFTTANAQFERLQEL